MDPTHPAVIEIETFPYKDPTLFDAFGEFQMPREHRRYRRVNLPLLPVEVQEALLTLTGGESPVTVRVGERPIYAPDIPWDDVDGWTGFVGQVHQHQVWEREHQVLMEQRQQQEAREREQFNALIERCLTLTDGELFLQSEHIKDHFPPGLSSAEEERGWQVVNRLKALLEREAERVSLEHERWIDQHGSETLRGLRQQHLGRWWVNMIDFVPEGYHLLERDPRVVPIDHMDVFLYEYVQHLHPGGLYMPVNDTLELGAGVPVRLFEEARRLGGELRVIGDHQMIPFPAYVSEVEKDELEYLRFAVVVPWRASHVLYPLEALESRSQYIDPG